MAPAFAVREGLLHLPARFLPAFGEFDHSSFLLLVFNGIWPEPANSGNGVFSGNALGDEKTGEHGAGASEAGAAVDANAPVLVVGLADRRDALVELFLRGGGQVLDRHVNEKEP